MKLAINTPGDEYEQAADRVVQQVMCMPEPQQQLGKEHERLQAKGIGSSELVQLAVPPIVNEVLASSGQPLDLATRTFFEPRFGYDFSRIRVHADATAADSARALGAHAYTVGRNIVFGASQFVPGTPDGWRLLAHELAHVLQQRAAPASSSAAITTSRASGMVQRQPAGTPAATSRNPTDNIKDAIELLRKVQPLFIHQALSAVSVNAGSAQVHTVEHTSGGKPVTSVFTLELKVAALGGFKLAEFESSAVPKQSGGTQTFAMTIRVSDKAANFPPETLARDLLHEGMHMQLFVDRAVPSWSSSLYLKGFQDYLAAARKSANHAPLVAELTAFIKKNAKGKTQAVAAREAKEIVEKIIEEKYVIDVTEQSSLGSKAAPPSLSDRQRDYLTLTTRWLVTYLDQVGVTNRPPDEIRSIAGKLVTLWSEIDANAPRPPRYPVPTGKFPQSEPDILPAPLPAPPQ